MVNKVQNHTVFILPEVAARIDFNGLCLCLDATSSPSPSPLRPCYEGTLSLLVIKVEESPGWLLFTSQFCIQKDSVDCFKSPDRFCAKWPACEPNVLFLISQMFLFIVMVLSQHRQRLSLYDKEGHCADRYFTYVNKCCWMIILYLQKHQLFRN